MFTWTFKRWAVAIAVFVAGCGETEPTFAFLSPEMGPSAEDRDLAQRPLERTRLSGIRVATPEGYCIDRRTRAPTFAMVFPCATLTRDPVPASMTNAAMRVTIGPELSTGFDATAIENALDTAPGRAALSRSGQADDVTLLETIRREGVVYAYIRDRAENPMGAAHDTEWRAITSVGGRMISLSASGYGQSAIDDDDGLRLLEQLLVSITAANRQGDGLSDLFR